MGPRSIGTLKIIAHDFRTDGKWHYELKGHDGSVVSFFGEFFDIDAPQGYTNSFGFEGPFGGTGDKLGRETQSFEDLGATTRYVGISHFDDLAERDAAAASGMEAGARENLDQLEALLAELASR